MSQNYVQLLCMTGKYIFETWIGSFRLHIFIKPPSITVRDDNVSTNNTKNYVLGCYENYK